MSPARRNSRRLLRAVPFLLVALLAVLLGARKLTALATRSDDELLRAGTPAPDFAGATRDGGTLRLSSFRGQVVVLDFWASWCPDCQEAMPHLEAVTRAVAGQKVQVFGLCVWDQRSGFDAWVDQHRADYHFQVAYDPAGRSQSSVASAQYHVVGIPTTYVIDPEGRVADVIAGGGQGGAGLEAALRRLGVKLPG